jgi:hypothetical protein
MSRVKAYWQELQNNEPHDEYDLWAESREAQTNWETNEETLHRKLDLWILEAYQRVSGLDADDPTENLTMLDDTDEVD